MIKMVQGLIFAEMRINSSLYKKLGSNGEWEDFFSEVLDFITLKAEEFCKAPPDQEGAPVGETGFLSASTVADLKEKLTKYLRNNMEYWIYVVYGTSKQKANNFPGRAANRIISEGWINTIVQIKLKEKGLK